MATRIFVVALSILVVQVWSNPIIVDTTSGQLIGNKTDGVASFKGIRFAHPPVGDLRWEAPVEFVSSHIQNATSLGPACVQQFAYGVQSVALELFNNPAPPEDEDCLYLNVWAPAPISDTLKPVIVWFFGGGLAYGTASSLLYDGTSFAKNQDVVFVSFNYRTNVFGFPRAPDLPASGNNLGFLDQELALAWVQDNIAQFGGDRSKVTIMGQSAGSESVSLAIARRNSTVTPPFRAGILLSGLVIKPSVTIHYSAFNAFAMAMNCTQSPGQLRLECLRNISASTIRNYTNGPDSGKFTFLIDNVTAPYDPLQLIRTGQIAQVPILLGNNQDEGSEFAYDTTETLSAYLEELVGPYSDIVTPTLVRELYRGLNDTQVMAAVDRDTRFRCPVKLWSEAYVRSGIKNVYRYTYGAVFDDLFPYLGAWHCAELPILFGTYNTSTATSAEVELSQTFQTAIANFAKDPVDSPAPNWPAYEPGFLGIAHNPTLAKISYDGNVDPDDFIQSVQPISTDGPCIVWDPFLEEPSSSANAEDYLRIMSMAENEVLRVQVLG